MAAIRQRQRSVHWLLPLLPALLALLLLGLLVVATDRIVGSELARRAEYRVEQTAQQYADRLERVLARRAVELELVALLAATDVPPDLLRSELGRLKTVTNSYVWIGVTDLRGTVRLATDGILEGESIEQRPVFVNGSQGLWFGSFHPPKALIEPLQRANLPVPKELADLAVPVVGANGLLQGVAASHLDAAYFENLRKEVLGPESAQRSMQLALLDDQGTLLGLITAKDIDRQERLPFATRDAHGRLRVGAAIGAPGAANAGLMAAGILARRFFMMVFRVGG